MRAVHTVDREESAHKAVCRGTVIWGVYKCREKAEHQRKLCRRRGITHSSASMTVSAS